MRDFRFIPGYRKLLCYEIPLIMVNEIDPIFDLCKRDELVVFDIGANTGVWTKALLNHSDKFIDKLYLFEPLPGNLDILYHRVSAGFYDPHTEKIEIVSKAVSDQVRLLNLNYDQEYTGYASISNNETLFGPQSIALSRQIQVESVTIDASVTPKDTSSRHNENRCRRARDECLIRCSENVRISYD